jgi:hypothetical protein
MVVKWAMIPDVNEQRSRVCTLELPPCNGWCNGKSSASDRSRDPCPPSDFEENSDCEESSSGGEGERRPEAVAKRGARTGGRCDAMARTASGSGYANGAAALANIEAGR